MTLSPGLKSDDVSPQVFELVGQDPRSNQGLESHVAYITNRLV